MQKDKCIKGYFDKNKNKTKKKLQSCNCNNNNEFIVKTFFKVLKLRYFTKVKF